MDKEEEISIYRRKHTITYETFNVDKSEMAKFFSFYFKSIGLKMKTIWL